ncbi:RNA-directed DNA polymerase from mobile element jockey-like 48 [Homarus americanus]|uniref:RNA-directed DNA polymerase from mobile element jockey-like 48 n=1 Tax=Homarus americanus TaxID=6706 RepID=A0A8J5JGH5_HOMAM|nr:RNA-directed DNA polymerase from mobile element jockey-like 48 [Homarus americanus]
MLKIREDKWLEWCATINAHTSLSELWRKLRIATRKLPRAPAHPQPLQEATRLAEHFAERSSSAQLPPEIRLNKTSSTAKTTGEIRNDCLFTIEDIRRKKKTSKGTAPGSDGLAGELALLTVINASWSAGKLPSAWKRANIVPIPKPNDPQNFRPISLTAYIGKTAKRMVLKRLLWKTGPLHHNIFGFTKGLTSLQTRTERLTTCFATKLITRARESDIKNGLLRALNLNRDCAADAVNRLELKDTTLRKGPDTMSPDYSTPAPRESPPAVINILQTGTRKADSNPHELQKVPERNMKALTPLCKLS